MPRVVVYMAMLGPLGLIACATATSRAGLAGDASVHDASAGDGGHGDASASDASHADASAAQVCTPGADQTCNDDPAISSLHGHCEPDATCTCTAPFERTASGRCSSAPADAGTELHDCNLDSIGCELQPPECPTGQVLTQRGLCYGPCVPIEQCACTAPSDCPDPNQYTCHLYAHHCGPYL